MWFLFVECNWNASSLLFRSCITAGEESTISSRLPKALTTVGVRPKHLQHLSIQYTFLVPWKEGSSELTVKLATTSRFPLHATKFHVVRVARVVESIVLLWRYKSVFLAWIAMIFVIRFVWFKRTFHPSKQKRLCLILLVTRHFRSYMMCREG